MISPESKQESEMNMSSGELSDENWEWPDASVDKDVKVKVSCVKVTF